MTTNPGGRIRRPHRTLTPTLRLSPLFGLIVISLGLLMACQPGSLEPPRAATLTAQAALSATDTPSPLISSAPTATPGESQNEASAIDPSAEDASAGLTLWISNSADAGIEGLEEGVADFTAGSGIQVEIVRVAPRLLPELIRSAVISGTLPDLVLHSADYSHGWAKEGILDTTSATAVLESLGRDTFEPGALAQLTVDSDTGSIAALPSDGWQQLLLYRTDWLDELGLSPPNTYSDLAAAAEAIHEVDSPISGIIVPPLLRAGGHLASRAPRSSSTRPPPAAACRSTCGISNSPPRQSPTSISSPPSTGLAKRNTETTTSTARPTSLIPVASLSASRPRTPRRNSSCAISTST